MHHENYDWSTDITFKTTINLENGIFDTLILFLKAPPSDLRQKTRLMSSNFPVKEIPERWSTLFKLEIPFEKLGSEGNDLEIQTTQNVSIISDPYVISKDIRLIDLPEIWEEKEYIREYLQPTDLVESNSPVINTLTDEIIDDTMSFWKVIAEIAKWITLRIIYVDSLKEAPYQGALQTLQSRKAICVDFVHVFLAMTRAANIPSRAITGFAKLGKPRRWDSHSWAEVYDPKFGWTPVDVVVQPPHLGSLGPFYIRRSAGFNCLDRIHAYYPKPEIDQEKNPITLHIKQEVIIEDQSVIIQFHKKGTK